LVGPKGEGLEATVTLVDGTGAVAGERILVSPSLHCGELSESIELAVAMAIDPLLLSRPPPAPATEGPSLPPPPPVEPPVRYETVERPEPELESPPPSMRFEVGVGATANGGTAPSIGAGFALSAALRWPRFSLALEGRTDIPSGVEISTGSVESAFMGGALVPCMRGRYFGFCGVGMGGALRSRGKDLRSAADVTTPFAAVGARTLVELPLVPAFALRLHVEVAASLIRTTLLVGNVESWSSPPVVGSAGLTLVLIPSEW
jgi:hypothetical protein